MTTPPMPSLPVLTLLAAALLLLLPPVHVQAVEPHLDLIARQQQRERHRMLMSHGVNTNREAILDFIENGFSRQAIQRGLPSEPEIKTAVMNTAIREAGFRRMREAVPILSNAARGQLNEAMQGIIRRDIEGMPIQSMEERQFLYGRRILFDSVVALGYIGDPDGIDAVLHAMENHRGVGMLREGSIALALKGDERGLARIAEQLPRYGDPDEQADLFAAIYYITGRNYGVRDVTSVARRREAVEEFRQWHANNSGISGGRDDIFRRRLNGLQFPDPPIASLRGALRASVTFGDFDKRYAARQTLRQRAQDSVSELKEIATDPLEDLDIRQAAMEWYAASDPRGARRDIRRLRNDENARIAQVAERLVNDIELAIEREGSRGGIFPW